jgi:hypothetical protein
MYVLIPIVTMTVFGVTLAIWDTIETNKKLKAKSKTKG